MPRPLVILLALSLLGGCKERPTPAPERVPTSGGPSDWPARDRSAELPPPARPQELPVTAADGAIGEARPSEVLDAADDGSWVVLCRPAGNNRRAPTVVLGEGRGLDVDRVLAWGPHDLAIVRAKKLQHVDVVARTVRDLGPAAPVAIDGRRVVHARGEDLVVLDPLLPPRAVAAGGAVAAIEVRNQRWAEVGLGTLQNDLETPMCDRSMNGPAYYQERATLDLDLDPGRAEAADRIGPTLGITAAGEVTLDGEAVIGADCVAYVIAALAGPPRALATCRNGPTLLVGPGFGRKVDEYLDNPLSGDASISPTIALGRRLPCFRNACVDLITGQTFPTNNDLVLADDQLIVRKQGSGLRIDTLAADATTPPAPPRTVALPRVTQAVTIDTATGRRTATAAPIAPRFIDRAGRWLLYGRYVVDLQDAVLVATLADDAHAIDLTGRVLISASPGTGPFRWKKP